MPNPVYTPILILQGWRLTIRLFIDTSRTLVGRDISLVKDSIGIFLQFKLTGLLKSEVSI